MANLYKRANGSLVIAASAPGGTTLVTFNPADTLSVNAPLYRTLDSSSPAQFHPAIYSAASETNLLDRPLQARFDLINANISSVSADISDTYTRVVTDAQQTVSRLASLEANYNGTVAAQAVISYNQTVLTSADLAMATQINLMQAAYGDVYASLTDTNTALATATASLAERTTTIEGSLNGNTASIKTTQSVVDGIDTTYAVTVNNNGSLSGFALTSSARNGGTPTSAFIIAADKFAVVDSTVDYTGVTTPNPADCPFMISGGVTYIKEANIADLTIGANHIKNNSASSQFAEHGFYSSSSWTANTTYEVHFIDIPAPTGGRSSNSGATVIASGAVYSAITSGKELTFLLQYSETGVLWHNLNASSETFYISTNISSTAGISFTLVDRFPTYSNLTSTFRVRLLVSSSTSIAAFTKVTCNFLVTENYK